MSALSAALTVTTAIHCTPNKVFYRHDPENNATHIYGTGISMLENAIRMSGLGEVINREYIPMEDVRLNSSLRLG